MTVNEVQAPIRCRLDFSDLFVRPVVAGGYGGMKAYAGAWLDGHTGHAASCLSAGALRRLAAGLIEAADRIDASGIPSFEKTR